MFRSRRRQSIVIGLLMGLGVAAGLARSALSPAATDRFAVPAAAVRSAAVGPIATLTPTLRAAFDPEDPAFSAIPSPGPADWLANHFELGQTFAQYQQGQPNRPDRDRRTIYLQPMGEFATDATPDLSSIRQFAEAFFSLPVTQLESVPLAGLPIESRPRQGGRQILSTDVLDWLKPRVPKDAYCLLAITMTDLYPDPKWNFVFGQASLIDRVGVYSFARYRSVAGDVTATQTTSDRPLLLLRSCKVLAHETGHMFGLKHCVHFHCLMNGSNNLAETDAAPIHLCPVCLRKLHWANAFDLQDRYERLRAFSVQVGWEQEASWLNERIQMLAQTAVTAEP